jgi:hypothetical protein
MLTTPPLRPSEGGAGGELAEDHQDRVGDLMTLARAPLGLAGGEREIAQSRRNGVGEYLAYSPERFASVTSWTASAAYKRNSTPECRSSTWL